MRLLVTGANGTLGRALRSAAEAGGVQFFAWDRGKAPPHDREAIERTVHDIRPDLVAHLAAATQPTGAADEGRLVSVEWTRRLARAAHDAEAIFLFTSSVMVYSPQQAGPHRPGDEPDGLDRIGAEKLDGERAARVGCPDARIARLGWQIGRDEDGNHMAAHLQRQQDEQGTIRANRRWRPSCCALDATARALLAVAARPAGTYLVEGNRGWTFDRIARALADNLGRDWNVEAFDGPVWDQRMDDPRVPVDSLDRTLDGLGEPRQNRS